ncbi:MAG: glycosyltransferase family 4 protein [Elusimicrobiota bacterium]|nr:glycosyltransferase family 4 protein [Elusimicrobiota bacterium]
MKLKICMLIARFYPITGGTELQAQRLSETLINSGHEVFVLTARLKGLKKYEVLNGLPIYRTFALGQNFISSFCFCFSSFLFLIKNLKKYDIIHVHLASSHAFSAVFIKELFSKKIVLKFGGARATGDIRTSLSKPFGKLKLKIIKKYFDVFVVPSNEIHKELTVFGFPIQKIVKISNGVNTDYFKQVSETDKLNLRKELNLPEKGFIAIYTGRLEKGKGIEFLIKQWSAVKNVDLLILGSGSLESELKKPDIENNIHFLGFKDNIKEYLQASDIFILPSFGEGLSNALLEAMSCGLVVIANKIPANEEVITNNINGIIIDILDERELTLTIDKLTKNKELLDKLGNHARETVKNYFSITRIADLYITLYKKIL